MTSQKTTKATTAKTPAKKRTKKTSTPEIVSVVAQSEVAELPPELEVVTEQPTAITEVTSTESVKTSAIAPTVSPEPLQTVELITTDTQQSKPSTSVETADVVETGEVKETADAEEPPKKPKKIITIIPTGTWKDPEPGEEPPKQEKRKKSEDGEDEENKEPPDTRYFQAIGVISGDVNLKSEPYPTIAIQGKVFNLLYAPAKPHIFEYMKMQIKTSGSNKMRLLVYPRIVHLPKKDQPSITSFQVVGFDQGNKQGLFAEMDDFEFKLSGLWQFIPVSQTPCISIFRNKTGERVQYVKNQEDMTKRVNFMKPSHVPVIWKDAIIRPFRFNPTADKDKQGKAEFVEIKAKFIPNREVFGFMSLLGLPQVGKVPRFLKARKDDKATAMKLRRDKLKMLKGVDEKTEPKTDVKVEPENKPKKKIITIPLKKVEADINA